MIFDTCSTLRFNVASFMFIEKSFLLTRLIKKHFFHYALCKLEKTSLFCVKFCCSLLPVRKFCVTSFVVTRRISCRALLFMIWPLTILLLEIAGRAELSLIFLAPNEENVTMSAIVVWVVETWINSATRKLLFSPTAL